MSVGYSGVANFANTYPGTATRVVANANEGYGNDVGGREVIVSSEQSAVPSLALNFLGTTIDPRITFTRASSATMFDSSGTLIFAPMNAIRNNTMVGAVAGTPGTLPTNWAISGLGTLTQTVVGTGTANGITYIDLRFSGTTSTTVVSIRHEPGGTGGVAAANGQSWAQSAWTAVIAGSTTNITQVGLSANIYDSGGAFLASVPYTNFIANTTSTLTRVTPSGTIATVGTAFIQPQIYLTFSSGAAIDITLRIGMPQLQRGSTATAVNATSGTAYQAPRLDYNPATLAPRGLLIEEQRTNSLLRSAEFDNASWVKTRATVTANTTVAPDGTTSADSLVEDGTAANTHDLRQGGVVNSATTTWTLSFFLKAVNRTWALIELQNAASTGNRARAWFNLQTGVVGTGNTAGSGVTYVSHSIQNVGNGWYRCVVVGTVDVSVTNIQSWVEGTIADNTSNYNGVDGQTSIYVWGAQLEAGAFPTSYIPTTTAAATRSADVASVNTLSPWWNSAAGTFYTEFSVPQLGRAGRLAAVDDGSLTNMVDTTVSATNGVAIEAVAAGVYGGFASAVGSITANTTQKSAFTFSTSASETACLNAGTVGSGAVTLPSVSLTRLLLGRQSNGVELCGYLRRLTFYPRQLSNAELQAITA